MDLFRSKTPKDKSFEIVTQILQNGKEMRILTLAGKPLDDNLKFRLKSEALAFKNTMLFKLITSIVEEDMKKEIVENCKDLKSLDYYRAILADRIMLEKEILTWANANVEIPKQKFDTDKLIPV